MIKELLKRPIGVTMSVVDDRGVEYRGDGVPARVAYARY